MTFEINDRVVYGVMGVCEVVDIAAPPIKGIDAKYYYLQPIYDSKGIIYSPVESNKVLMRYVISRDDAEKLYKKAEFCIKDEELNEPVAMSSYDEMVKSQNPAVLMHLVRSLYNIKNERAKEMRKMKSVDSNMLSTAKKLLYGEMAAALDRDVKEVTEELDAMLGR